MAQALLLYPFIMALFVNCFFFVLVETKSLNCPTHYEHRKLLNCLARVPNASKFLKVYSTIFDVSLLNDI